MAQQSEQIKMNFSAVAISTLGFISALFTCFMNFILLKTYMKKKNDMALFYYRFALDVIMGALLAGFLLLAVLYSAFSNQFSYLQNLIFYFSLPASNVAACRSIVALTVAIERMVVSRLPMRQYYRQQFPTVIILMLAVIFGLTEDAVLYGFCDFRLNMPKNCAALGCALNPCFFNYWTTHKATIFVMTLVFIWLLCIKLFIINNITKTGAAELSRVNRLALIDAAIVCTFDYLPNFIAKQFSTTQFFSYEVNRLALIDSSIVVMFDFLPNFIASQNSKTEFFSFQNIGPYGTVAKLLGCAIEAFLVFRTMRKGNESRLSENSRSSSRHLKHNITKV
ncbi:hypothetical protein L5515_006300 [Caenorhabditis briggsae]|uniref:Serpentine Receptor, class BC (Class B-like) n=1 Tax=Caenorhabditis briggsae TaxID=6238 RepID=A0AAE9EVM1_CAEBR|nr:hypothetical protein L5515_006300 [Caenorhabditis briggsae]